MVTSEDRAKAFLTSWALGHVATPDEVLRERWEPDFIAALAALVEESEQRGLERAEIACLQRGCREYERAKEKKDMKSASMDSFRSAAELPDRDDDHVKAFEADGRKAMNPRIDPLPVVHKCRPGTTDVLCGVPACDSATISGDRKDTTCPACLRLWGA
jgi:hypothetical protein